jgi:hypothetical protein
LCEAISPGQAQQGLKPHTLGAFFGPAKQFAEKGLDSGEIGEKQTSGPEGRADSAAFVPGINPRPTSRRSLSAACKAVPMLQSFKAL